MTRVELLRKVAELHEEGRGDLKAAFEAYGRAFAEDPASEELQAHLERLAGRLGLWADLAALYEKRLTDIYDDYLGRRLTMTLARVYEENLASDARAVERYNKALEFSGDEAEPLFALNRLLERTRDYPALAKVLGKLVDVVPDGSQQAAFLFRLGELRRLEFKDLDGALQAYRDVLDREPSHAGALAALEALLAEPTCAARVLDILEPVYESAQNHERLAYLAWKRLELITDPEDRARLLERIAELSEHQLGDPAAAQNAYGHALIQRPDEPSYLDQLERLAMQLGRWAEAAAVLENVLTREDLDDQVILSLSLKCAGWYADALQDVRRAELYYQKALTKDPENLDALGRVESIYRSLGDVRQLLDVLQRKADLDYDLDSKKQVLAEIAELAESALGDAARAAGAWKAIADLDEADPQAQAALIRLYEAAGQFEALVEVLERVARFTQDAAQGLAYRHRMGELLLGQLSDADRAIAAYKDCLDVEPADEVALSALESIYAAREEWSEVQDIVLRRLSGVDPGPARIPVLEKLAQLAERRFNNADEATDYWNQILSYDPGNQNAFAQVERILEAGARWYDLVDVLKKHGEYHAAMGDRDGEVAQLVRTSRLWEEKLESPEAAAEILETILARDPNNVRALTGLARMHERTQDWDKCREVLSRAAALSPAGAAGAELYFRMAKVEEKLGNAAGARDCLSRALALDPTHAEALAAAEAAARAAGDWMEVAHLVHAKASSASDAEVQFPLLVELGLLYMQKLGHAEGGLPYLEQALRIRPSDPAVLGPLADLYIAAKRFGEAEQLIRGLIDAGQKAKKKPRDLAPFHYKLGMLAEARGDLAAATAAFDAAYKMDTTYTPVVVAQGRLAMNAKDWEKARRIFRAMLLQNLDEAVAGISKADVYYNLGWIHEQLSEKPKAINMYERGLELSSSHENLRAGLGRCKG
jgi:tetratricopeptide (TPR) repeat protein